MALTGQRGVPLESNKSTSSPTPYAESCVDSVVVGRRRAPPPPPPRTSSRSPLAPPLRAPLQSRPLPSLPSEPSFVNRGPLSPQLIIQSQRARRNSSLSTTDSIKVPTQESSPRLFTGIMASAPSGLVRRASHTGTNCKSFD